METINLDPIIVYSDNPNITDEELETNNISSYNTKATDISNLVGDILSDENSNLVAIGSSSLQLKGLKIQSDINNAKMVADSNRLLAKAQVDANRLAEGNQGIQGAFYTQNAEISENALLMQNSILTEMQNNTEVLNTLILAIKNKSVSFTAGDVNTGDLNVDLESVVNVLEASRINQVAVNTKIVESIEEQKTMNVKILENIESKLELNTKLKEKLDFEKGVGENVIKDSDGAVISPRSIKALKDNEIYVDNKEMNDTRLDEIIDFFGTYVGDPLDTITDLSGLNDGFLLSANPMNLVFEALEEDWLEEINKLKDSE